MINNNWVFGHGARLNFSSLNQNTLAGSNISAPEGCASISNAAGQLLFYTDGITVWDRNGFAQIASLGLTGHTSSTQAVAIVPRPLSPSQYYIFTTGATYVHVNAADYNGNKLCAALVDTTSWSFTPVSDVNTHDGANPFGYCSTERLAVIADPVRRNYWVLSTIRTTNQPLLGSSLHGNPPMNQAYFNLAGSGMLRIFRVSDSGVQHHSDYRIPLNGPAITVSHHGYLKGSLNGRLIAIANGLLENVVLIDFDNQLGIPSNPRVLPLNRPLIAAPPVGLPKGIKTDNDLILYGVEFSPNSEILYASATTHRTAEMPNYHDSGPVQGVIVGMDLTNPNIPQSIVAIEGGGTNAGYSFGALQLGPNGKIYVARDQETHLGVIQTPNNLTMPSYVSQGQSLGIRKCGLGLPNNIPGM